MKDINTLIKQFVNSKSNSIEEQTAAYELACMAASLYHENEKLRGFNTAIFEESRMDG